MIKRKVGRPTKEKDPVIGQRIKAARKEKKLTQQKLAEKINVSVDTIKKWESGFHQPSDVNMWKALSEELDVSISELMNKDGQEQKLTEWADGILKSPELKRLYQLQQQMDNLMPILGYPQFTLQELQLKNPNIYPYMERCIKQALSLIDKDQQQFIELSLKYAIENFKFISEGVE